MSEAAADDSTRIRSGRAWPERPGPQGQERRTRSEAAADDSTRIRSGRT